MKKLILIPVFLSALISCDNKIKSSKGGIDMISNVYFNASKGLDEIQTYYVTKINYSNDSILELIPDINFPSINIESNFILDTAYYPISTNAEQTLISDLLESKAYSVFQKENGAIYTNEEIPNYDHRRPLPDTILFKKKYKRFEINSPDLYSRFYIYQTDTILPYSLYKHVEKDYEGRLERIDTYNKNTDVFVTLQIIPRKNWDDEAEEFFNYNDYAKKVK
ncbi:hypothetical protein ACF3NR_07990 [Vaginella massiliensis]|uniref:hypothetical protein n=1 Tax=Vaginella massiliensis TaxID=1816680 RepID=UPI000838D043|nr:hypothetical protein [Vaginella massiliensis]